VRPRPEFQFRLTLIFVHFVVRLSRGQKLYMLSTYTDEQAAESFGLSKACFNNGEFTWRYCKEETCLNHIRRIYVFNLLGHY